MILIKKALIRWQLSLKHVEIHFFDTSLTAGIEWNDPVLPAPEFPDDADGENKGDDVPTIFQSGQTPGI